jgi:hypothetical protein
VRSTVFGMQARRASRAGALLLRDARMLQERLAWYVSLPVGIAIQTP